MFISIIGEVEPNSHGILFEESLEVEQQLHHVLKVLTTTPSKQSPDTYNTAVVPPLLVTTPEEDVASAVVLPLLSLSL